MNEGLRKPGMYGSIGLCLVAWIFATVGVCGASQDSSVILLTRWWQGNVGHPSAPRRPASLLPPPAARMPRP